MDSRRDLELIVESEFGRILERIALREIQRSFGPERSFGPTANRELARPRSA